MPVFNPEHDRLLTKIEEESSASSSTPATPKSRETRKVSRFTLEIDHNNVVAPAKINGHSSCGHLNGFTGTPTSQTSAFGHNSVLSPTPTAPGALSDLIPLSRNNSTSMLRFLFRPCFIWLLMKTWKYLFKFFRSKHAFKMHNYVNGEIKYNNESVDDKNRSTSVDNLFRAQIWSTILEITQYQCANATNTVTHKIWTTENTGVGDKHTSI